MYSDFKYACFKDFANVISLSLKWLLDPENNNKGNNYKDFFLLNPYFMCINNNLIHKD